MRATCPFCWEPVEVDFDPLDAGPGEHRFVQDCDVCCHPIAFVVRVDRDGTSEVEVERAG